MFFVNVASAVISLHLFFFTSTCFIANAIKKTQQEIKYKTLQGLYSVHLLLFHSIKLNDISNDIKISKRYQAVALQMKANRSLLNDMENVWYGSEFK